MGKRSELLSALQKELSLRGHEFYDTGVPYRLLYGDWDENPSKTRLALLNDFGDTIKITVWPIGSVGETVGRPKVWEVANPNFNVDEIIKFIKSVKRKRNGN